MEEIIVVATNEEYKLAKKRFKNKKIIKTGVGGLNVISKLKDLNKNTIIFNFGYAGSNNLPIGSEIKIKCSSLYHPNVKYKEKKYYINKKGYNCYTSNDFVLTTNIIEPCVFDMELAYIVALGFKKVKSIKIISDNLSLKEYEKEIGL